MPTATGAVASFEDVLNLGDLIEKTKTVVIIRDGEPVPLTAYAEGDGCPVSVLMRVSAARDRYFGGDRELNWREAEDAFFEAVIREVVPALTALEIDVVAGNPEKRKALLQYLGWVAKPAAIADPEATDSPEVSGGVESTTANSSPDSASSTASPGASS